MKNKTKKSTSKTPAKGVKKPVTGKKSTAQGATRGTAQTAKKGKTALPKKSTVKSGAATSTAGKPAASVPARKGERVGKVYRGKTKYIDKETKPTRNYVVLLDTGETVTVAKLKSIKIFDENGKNADKALVEINATRYGLEKRTGVDFQRFDKNRMSGKPLKIEDKDVFPEETEQFTMSNKDKDRSLFHTGVRKRKKKKK